MTYRYGGCKSHWFLQTKAVAEPLQQIFNKALPFIRDHKETIHGLLENFFQTSQEYQKYVAVLRYVANDKKALFFKKAIDATLALTVDASNPQNIKSGVRISFSTHFIPEVIKKIAYNIPLPTQGPFAIPGSITAEFNSNHDSIQIKELTCLGMNFKEAEINAYVKKAGYTEGYPISLIQSDFKLPFSLKDAPIHRHPTILSNIVDSLKDPYKDSIKLDEKSTDRKAGITFVNGSKTNVQVLVNRHPAASHESNHVVLKNYENETRDWVTHLEVLSLRRVP